MSPYKSPQKNSKNFNLNKFITEIAFNPCLSKQNEMQNNKFVFGAILISWAGVYLQILSFQKIFQQFFKDKHLKTI